MLVLARWNAIQYNAACRSTSLFQSSNVDRPGRQHSKLKALYVASMEP